MENVKVGDIVRGFGWSRNRDTIMQVTRLRFGSSTPILIGISGLVVSPQGRLTHVEENIGLIDLIQSPSRENQGDINLPTIIKKKGGWEILQDFKLKTEPESLAQRIRSLEIGQSINVIKDEHNINTCRCTASQMGSETGGKYRVSKTESGCTISRVD